jgi:hypothetical protein
MTINLSRKAVSVKAVILEKLHLKPTSLYEFVDFRARQKIIPPGRDRIRAQIWVRFVRSEIVPLKAVLSAGLFRGFCPAQGGKGRTKMAFSNITPNVKL